MTTVHVQSTQRHLDELGIEFDLLGSTRAKTIKHANITQSVRINTMTNPWFLTCICCKFANEKQLQLNLGTFALLYSILYATRSYTVLSRGTHAENAFYAGLLQQALYLSQRITFITNTPETDSNQFETVVKNTIGVDHIADSKKKPFATAIKSDSSFSIIEFVKPTDSVSENSDMYFIREPENMENFHQLYYKIPKDALMHMLGLSALRIKFNYTRNFLQGIASSSTHSAFDTITRGDFPSSKFVYTRLNWRDVGMGREWYETNCQALQNNKEMIAREINLIEPVVSESK